MNTMIVFTTLSISGKQIIQYEGEYQYSIYGEKRQESSA